MIRGAAALLAWLCLGHGAAAGLYLALINVPDANAGMLAASAGLVVAILFSAGFTSATAVNWLRADRPERSTVWAGATRGLPAAGLAAGVYALFWYAAGAIRLWYESHAGEVDAWWMATFDSSATAPVHRAIAALLFALRDIVGVSMALAIFCGIALYGLRALATAGWVRAAFSRRQLGMVALAVVLLVALPWRLVGWRPAGLPAGWAEPAFVGLKLLTIYVLAHAGWAAMLIAAARAAGSRHPSRQWQA